MMRGHRSAPVDAFANFIAFPDMETCLADPFE
jgi:hypothetical protein